MQPAPGFETILTVEALGSSPSWRASSALASRNCWREGSNGRRRSTPAAADFLRRRTASASASARDLDSRDLQDRRVEITGPTDRKMIINALNSGAKVFMADCEDSMTDLGQRRAGSDQPAGRRGPSHRLHESGGKPYRLNDKVATLIVRPRGWHLFEKHVLVDGRQVPGAFVTSGSTLHNHAELSAAAPAVFLPAEDREPPRGRLWAEVFRHAEARLGLAPQTSRRRC